MPNLARFRPQTSRLEAGSPDEKEAAPFLKSSDSGFAWACACDRVCRARLGMSTECRRAAGGPGRADPDITSRKEGAGSILQGFMFTQLSSGHIDF